MMHIVSTVISRHHVANGGTTPPPSACSRTRLAISCGCGRAVIATATAAAPMGIAMPGIQPSPIAIVPPIASGAEMVATLAQALARIITRSVSSPRAIAMVAGNMRTKVAAMKAAATPPAALTHHQWVMLMITTDAVSPNVLAIISGACGFDGSALRWRRVITMPQASSTPPGSSG